MDLSIFPCDNCIVDVICTKGCDIFYDYFIDRLIGVNKIPVEFVKSESRYIRSLNCPYASSSQLFSMSAAKLDYDIVRDLGNKIKKAR